MRKSESTTGSRLLRAGFAVAATAVLAVAGTATPAFAANIPVTLSSTAGPTAGGNTITAYSTSTQAYLSGITAPVTTFSIPACQTTYNATASTAVTPSSATVGNVLAGANATKKVTNAKATITVPALAIAVSGSANTKYNVCMYASSTANAAQIASSSYTVAVAPVFPNSGVVSPSSGPALGGTKITVTATSGLPTTAGSITATLGGTALLAVTPVNATSFTAITPPHAPGMTNLVVTTAAGSKTITSAFEYANGVMIEPNTAPRTATAQPVDVMGAGFLNYDFTADAAVYLVQGAYDPGSQTSNSGGVATSYTVGPTAECTGVTVISDNELICSLNLATGALDPATGNAATNTNVLNGTYTLTVVSNGNVAQRGETGYAVTDISSGSTFTVAPY